MAHIQLSHHHDYILYPLFESNEKLKYTKMNLENLDHTATTENEQLGVVAPHCGEIK